ASLYSLSLHDALPILLLEQRVHLVVVHRLGELVADLVEAMDQPERVGDALLDGLPHGLLRIELRLLREVTDLDARLRARLAVERSEEHTSELQSRENL